MTSRSRCLARLALSLLLASAGIAAATPQGASDKQSAPPVTELQALTAETMARRKAEQQPAKPLKRVDINTASRAQLKKIPYIDDARAEQIVAGRPFAGHWELLSRKIVTRGQYAALKHQVYASNKAGNAPAKK